MIRVTPTISIFYSVWIVWHRIIYNLNKCRNIFIVEPMKTVRISFTSKMMEQKFSCKQSTEMLHKLPELYWIKVILNWFPKAYPSTQEIMYVRTANLIIIILPWGLQFRESTLRTCERRRSWLDRSCRKPPRRRPRDGYQCRCTTRADGTLTAPELPKRYHWHSRNQRPQTSWRGEVRQPSLWQCRQLACLTWRQRRRSHLRGRKSYIKH